MLCMVSNPSNHVMIPGARNKEASHMHEVCDPLAACTLVSYVGITKSTHVHFVV